jgi:hypothetical protein
MTISVQPTNTNRVTSNFGDLALYDGSKTPGLSKKQSGSPVTGPLLPNPILER